MPKEAPNLKRQAPENHPKPGTVTRASGSKISAWESALLWNWELGIGSFSIPWPLVIRHGSFA